MQTYHEKSRDQHDRAKNGMPHVMRSFGPFPIQLEEYTEECDPRQNSRNGHDRWKNLSETCSPFSRHSRTMSHPEVGNSLWRSRLLTDRRSTAIDNHAPFVFGRDRIEIARNNHTRRCEENPSDDIQNSYKRTRVVRRRRHSTSVYREVWRTVNPLSDAISAKYDVRNRWRDYSQWQYLEPVCACLNKNRSLLFASLLLVAATLRSHEILVGVNRIHVMRLVQIDEFASVDTLPMLPILLDG